MVILALVYAAVSFYVADSALDAEANPLEERPEDFALQYEDVEFSPPRLARAHPPRMVDTGPGRPRDGDPGPRHRQQPQLGAR